MSTSQFLDEDNNLNAHNVLAQKAANLVALSQQDGTAQPQKDESDDDGGNDDILQEDHIENDSEGNKDQELLDDDKIEDDDDDSLEKETKDDDEPNDDDISLGGVIDTKAFALITGVFVEDTGTRQVVSIPLTHLPATLGRSHDTKDPKFFGLGTRKVLSRQQVMIYYRDERGGRLIEDENGNLKYQQPSKSEKKDVLRTKDKEGVELPKTGFFVIECLGKNRIFVDGGRVEQGEVAWLTSGSSIRMNSYSLIFLLPEDATSTPMKIAGPKTKRKKPSPSTASSSKSGAALVESLETTPVATLLEWFFEAIENNQWERRHQMIGGAITHHACKDAARSKKIKHIADTNKGVSRSEVMDWIKNSKRYGKWVPNVLKKMELKSYQANVTKCLWKTGYRRNAPVGRFVRWNLPSLEELGPPEPLAEGEEEEDEDEVVEEEGKKEDSKEKKEDNQVVEDKDKMIEQDKKAQSDQDEGDTDAGSSGEDEDIENNKEQSDNSQQDEEHVVGAGDEVEEGDSDGGDDDEAEEEDDDSVDDPPDTQDVPPGKRLKVSSSSEEDGKQADDGGNNIWGDQ